VNAPLPPQPEFGDLLPIEPAPKVLDFLALRRSASALTLAEPAPDAGQVQELIRLAARAPDHGKLTPWRFFVFEGESKRAFAGALEAIARARGDDQAAAKLGKLKTPPLCIAVISSPRAGKIPEWEQRLSAGAVCVNLTYAALAMGFGANWITDWYAYDPKAAEVLGLGPDEKVAGYVMIGTTLEAPRERERPQAIALVSPWPPQAS
jgi:nitroreductase